jgi:hypothetical protein
VDMVVVGVVPSVVVGGAEEEVDVSLLEGLVRLVEEEGFMHHSHQHTYKSETFTGFFVVAGGLVFRGGFCVNSSFSSP